MGTKTPWNTNSQRPKGLSSSMNIYTPTRISSHRLPCHVTVFGVDLVCVNRFQRIYEFVAFHANGHHYKMDRLTFTWHFLCHILAALTREKYTCNAIPSIQLILLLFFHLFVACLMLFAHLSASKANSVEKIIVMLIDSIRCTPNWAATDV